MDLFPLKQDPAYHRSGPFTLRAEASNPGDYKPVGDGVYELRIFKGPGIRLYFAFQGDRMIVLLIGGDKSSQKQDIKLAKS